MESSLVLVIVAVSINSLQYSSSLELAREHNSRSTQALYS